jgi:hypothetical protein
MATKVGYNADIYIAAPASVAFAATEATTTSDRITYTITATAKRYWDRSVAVTVQTSPDGVTWGTVTVGFTIQYVGGKVIFTVQQAVGTQVRLTTGSYLPVSQLGQGREWTLDASAAMLDTSIFGSAWKTRIAGPIEAHAKLTRWWLDGYFATANNLTNLVVIVLYVDQPTGSRYEGFAYLKRDSIKAAVAGVVDEPLEFDFTGNVYYLAS